MIVSTGPKISSRAMRMELSASANKRGLDIPAPVQTVGRRSAADDEAGPLRLARLDVAAHPRLLALRDERTYVGDAVRRIPDHHRHHLGRQCVGEVAGAMGRDEDAG